VDYEYGAAWLFVETPGEWVTVEPITGPMARFQTTTAPCVVDTELYGFHIVAGYPYLYNGGVTFTDSQPYPGRFRSDNASRSRARLSAGPGLRPDGQGGDAPAQAQISIDIIRESGIMNERRG